MESFITCYNLVSGIMNQEDHPYKEDVVRHLFAAYYYGLGYYVHNASSQKSLMTGQQEVCERFIGLVSENFKVHREIGYYADRLGTTKKYLSALLKQESQKLPFIHFNDRSGDKRRT